MRKVVLCNCNWSGLPEEGEEVKLFFKMTFASALGNTIAWIALYFFLLSQSGCTIELFPIDFNTDVEVTMEIDGFCESNTDCNTEYPYCLLLDGVDVGLCVKCIADDACEEGEICGFDLVCSQ